MKNLLFEYGAVITFFASVLGTVLIMNVSGHDRDRPLKGVLILVGILAIFFSGVLGGYAEGWRSGVNELKTALVDHLESEERGNE